MSQLVAFSIYWTLFLTSNHLFIQKERERKNSIQGNQTIRRREIKKITRNSKECH